MSSTDRLKLCLAPGQKDISRIFEGIAPRYDFINSLLSFGMDRVWRKKARDRVLENSQKSILDLGMGTGKFLQLFLTKKKWARAWGLDFSVSMLQRAQKRLPSWVGLVQGDFHCLPFRRSSFDLVISGFTLRSVENLQRFLQEIYQVLDHRGKVALLCLTRPKRFFVKWLYYPYLKLYIPFVGRLISGHREAYHFLASSIATFQDPEETLAMMRRVGYVDLEIHALQFGIVTLLVGRRGA